MSQDPRNNTYRELVDRQMQFEEPQNELAARHILGMVFEYVKPASVLDVGCGLGTWMKVAQQMGVSDVRGIEGNWLERSRLVVDPAFVESRDLEQEFSLGRKFDLVICLEVAEHIAESSAPRFVKSLTQHSDLILFSAAIPYQGGHGHVNEKFLDYWAAIFLQSGFHPVDAIRGRIWNEARILWWLGQNTVLFSHERLLAANPKLQRERELVRPLSIVRPDVYLDRVNTLRKQLEEQAQLMQFVSAGGTFEVTRLPDGKLSIKRK